MIYGSFSFSPIPLLFKLNELKMLKIIKEIEGFIKKENSYNMTTFSGNFVYVKFQSRANHDTREHH